MHCSSPSQAGSQGVLASSVESAVAVALDTSGCVSLSGIEAVSARPVSLLLAHPALQVPNTTLNITKADLFIEALLRFFVSSICQACAFVSFEIFEPLLFWIIRSNSAMD